MSSLLSARLRPLQQFLQLFLQDLVGALLSLDVVLVGLAIAFLLFLVLHLHIANFLLQVVHLFFQFLCLAFQSADLVLHVLFLLFCLQGSPHAEGDRRFVEGLV